MRVRNQREKNRRANHTDGIDSTEAVCFVDPVEEEPSPIGILPWHSQSTPTVTAYFLSDEPALQPVSGGTRWTVICPFSL
jgi:hypothetical protein